MNDVVFESCLIAEALDYSIHPKGRHSMGALVGEGARNVTFLGNLFAANNDRNVRWKFDTTGEMINNVIYGWGGKSSWNTTNLTNSSNEKGIALDVVGNVYLPGPQGLEDAYAVHSDSTPKGTRVFVQDNLAYRPTDLSSAFIARGRVVGRTPPRGSSKQTLANVVATAGMRPWDRNPEDDRIIDGVLSRSLRLRNSVGRWPAFPANRRTINIGSGLIASKDLPRMLSYFER